MNHSASTPTLPGKVTLRQVARRLKLTRSQLLAVALFHLARTPLEGQLEAVNDFLLNLDRHKRSTVDDYVSV